MEEINERWDFSNERWDFSKERMGKGGGSRFSLYYS